MWTILLILSIFTIGTLSVQTCTNDPTQVPVLFPPLVATRLFNYAQVNQILYQSNLNLSDTINNLLNYMESTAYMALPVTGVFGGPNNHGLEGLVEYAWIANRFKNGGWSYKSRDIGFTYCWDPDMPDVAVINGTGAAVYNSRYLPDGTLYGGSEVVTGTRNTLYYDPGSYLIDHLVVDLGRNDQEARLIFQMSRNPHDVCQVIIQNCVGPNLAFNNLLECIDYMTSLPLMKCAPNYGQGDSFGCRFLHHFMTGFNPEVHCPHTTPASQVCVDTNCTQGFLQHDYCRDEIVCPNCPTCPTNPANPNCQPCPKKRCTRRKQH